MRNAKAVTPGGKPATAGKPAGKAAPGKPSAPGKAFGMGMKGVGRMGKGKGLTKRAGK